VPSTATPSSTLRLLDIGAGDGRVLKAAAKAIGSQSTVHYIEKSQHHRGGMPADWYLMGVDFHHTTLVDKEVDVIFCNPPYREYQEWARRILEEAQPFTRIYLVIPDRWDTSEVIHNILTERKIKPQILGSYGFTDADRKARGTVHLLRFDVPGEQVSGDPFDTFFDAHFPEAAEEPEMEEPEEDPADATRPTRESQMELMLQSYTRRLAQLEENFRAVCRLDPQLLQEFQLDRRSLAQSLKGKIKDLKVRSWERLFAHLEVVNRKLTSKSREKLLSRIRQHTCLDFNQDNILAVLEWVVQNANLYMDEQFVEVYERLMERANIDAYKSNQRVFKDYKFGYGHFSYRHNKEHHDAMGPVRLKVGHRIVLECVGGLYNGPFDFEKNKLSARAAEFLCDLMTLANTLGFLTVDRMPQERAWEGSEARTFYWHDGTERALLFEVRAFKNGNLHLRFDPRFVQALNIQYGKLRGWLHSPEEAADELDVDEANTSCCIGHTHYTNIPESENSIHWPRELKKSPPPPIEDRALLIDQFARPTTLSHRRCNAVVRAGSKPRLPLSASVKPLNRLQRFRPSKAAYGG
jgi:hypothetical protein